MTKMTKTQGTVPVPLISTSVSSNRGAFHWSYEKLACLGNGNEVFIIDSTSLDVVQVLYGHASPVTYVVWLPSGRQFCPAESKLCCRDVVSIDISNQLIVWDVMKAQQVGSFTHPESNRQVLDVQIPNGSDLWARTKLYLLYSGNLLIVYDYVHGSSQSVSVVNPALDCLGTPDAFVKFASDPYHTNSYTNCLAFLSWDGVTSSTSSLSLCKVWDCVKDSRIVIHRRLALDENGKSSKNQTGSSPSSLSKSLSSTSIPSNLNPLDNSKRQIPSSSSIRKLVSDIIVGPDYTNSSSYLVNQNLSISFHPGIKDTVIITTDISVSFVNIHFMIVLHSLVLEKHAAKFFQIIPTKSKPCIFTLMSNGTLILRKYTISGVHSMAVQLETLSYSENPRFTGKKNEVVGIVIHPYEENSAIVYLNDGRLLKYEVVSLESNTSSNEPKKHLTTPSTPLVRHFDTNNDQPQSDRKSPSKHSGLSVKSILETETDTNISMHLRRVTNSFGQFTVLKGRGELLVAGTTLGFIVVLNVIDNRLKALKKFTTHTSSLVSGIEFVSDSEILTYSNLSFSTNPKCELVLTEVWTGAHKVLKTDENNHIQTLRVSPSGQYFVLVYKNGAGPCELWDLPRRQLIKTLPNKLPPITCVHWRQPVDDSKEEVFYMTDLGTFLFTFRVEGNRFLSATCVKLENTAHVAGVPVALFSWNEYVFRADSNGVLVQYNTVKKTASPSISIGRGTLLNMLNRVDHENIYVVQFGDSVILWDFLGQKKIKSLHSGHLKTTSVGIIKNWVAYIPQNHNSTIRLLALDHNENAASNALTISSRKFPYFMDEMEKANQYLNLVMDGESTVSDLVSLSKECGSWEDFKFWSILHSKWVKHQPNLHGLAVFSDRNLYKEIIVTTAQCVWATDFHKRGEIARILLWCGESERAAEILLDTEPSDIASYVMNGLKASVAVGSSNLPEQSKAVLKIIATNLIACGDTDGGLELLCLLQKHHEAVKYVESSNDWDKAILLSLCDKHAEDSWCKYAQYINSKKCAYKAASIFLFYEKYDRAIEVLFGSRLRHLSYLLLHYCTKNGIQLSISDHIQTAIRLDFARFLFECGLQKESIQFCASLGETGNDLKQELEILST